MHLQAAISTCAVAFFMTRPRYSISLLAGLILLVSLPAGEAVAWQSGGDTVAVRADTAAVDTSRRVVPGSALLRSAVIPGWGQFYTKHPLKGGLMMAAQGTFIGMALRADGWVKDLTVERQAATDPSVLENDIEWWRGERRRWILWAFGLWLYSMADAFVDAHLFNFDEIEPQFEISTQPPGATSPTAGLWLGIRIKLGRPPR